MISVLTANFNNSQFIVAAIESVVKQSFPNWELVIVDDCSTDDSVEIIKKYLADSRIKFFKNSENNGYIRTLQRMISLAGGEILLILDSDDTLEDNALASISQVFENNPAVGYAYSQCNYCDEFLRPFKIGSKRIADQKSNINDNSIVHLRAFRKSVFFRTSGFDEECLYAEDYDLSLKLEELTKVFFIEKVLYNYRILKKSQTHGFRSEMINRSSVALARLNAYKRRKGTAIPNLSEEELAEALIWGIATAALAGRIELFKKFTKELSLRISVLFNPYLYILMARKIIKIIRFKFNMI
jgi:glycosyltransferase involved in cell wall biosynthesis